LCSTRKEQRSDIHRTVCCVGFVFGNEVQVASYGEGDGFEESRFGYFRDTDDVARMLHTSGVLIGSENSNLRIRVTESCTPTVESAS